MIFDRLVAAGLINRQVWSWLEQQDALAWRRYLRCRTNRSAAKRFQEYLDVRHVLEAYFMDAIERLERDENVLGASERSP